MRLLKSRIFRLTLRRSAWIRWLPPIDSASPSPVTTHTDRSGRDTDRPVAIAGARHEHDALARDVELRHEGLHRGQDRVVAATGAPADLLVGLEVLHGQLE